MHIGIPRERLEGETRVGITPDGVRQLIAAGHTLQVEHSAAALIGYPDKAYTAAGATLTDNAYTADFIVKVKGPTPSEFPLFRSGQTIAAYFHFAADPALAQAIEAAGVRALPYEDVRDASGRLPLLAPMSRIAGILAAQEGARSLHLTGGGRGLLLGPGVRVLVIGAGNVGRAAADTCRALGAKVTVMDLPLGDLAGALVQSDLVIGAAYIPGKETPRLLTRQMIATMPRGAALVDVSIDQGGISETSRPTTHYDPRYIEENVVHYCVQNMPAAVGRTATLDLTAATLPWLLSQL